MNPSDFIAGREGVGLSSAIEAMIKRSCIIDYGIIQNVVADGVVDVSVAVSKTQQDMIITTCVLANIASANFTLKIVPKKGDRVLVIYPRIFNDTMFKVEGDETKDTKIIVDKDAKGYNLASGIAVLLNQYKSSGHKNVITVDEGGTFTFVNAKATVSLDSDGYFHYKNTDTDNDNNSKIDFSSSGFTIQDKAQNKIVSDTSSGSESITINGHLKVKK